MHSRSPHRLRATAIGAIAILLWASLALLTTLSGSMPPFQLTALAFSVASILITAKWLIRREPVSQYLRQPLAFWLIGVGGFFGFHFFYFMALRSAPAVEASLIEYLWPLLIVVFSALLPGQQGGERLRWFHLAGALAGLLGTALLVTQGGSFTFQSKYWLGYVMALLCAITWAAYSVVNRRFSAVPTDSVGGICVVTAILAALCHLAFETTVWPRGTVWLAVIALGLGPMGVAFFVWDHGTKHGDLRRLGVLSYMTPLLSTALLIAAGKAAATWSIIASCLLITGGAALASLDILGRPAPDA